MSGPLPWQVEAWNRLCTQRRDERLPHALLLAGPAGVGKQRMARAFAASLLCDEPDHDMACGQCRACGYLAAGSHPDLMLLEPQDTSRAIRIDAVRELLAFYAGTAQQGGYKVAIVVPAEALNLSAANALLKCLEEPAGRSLLMLVSHAPGLLPATLRSRCQRVELPLPAPALAGQWLVPRVGAERSAELLAEAGGRPLEAERLLADDGLALRQRWRDQLDQLLAGDADPVSLAQDLQGDALQEWLNWLQMESHRRLRASVLDSGTGPAARRLMALFDAASELAGQFARGANPNPQLAVESLLLQMGAR